MIAGIAEQTGLQLTVDTYSPIARNAEKENLLAILVGADRPGIISKISATLGAYKANIEFAKTIGREGVFLMELLTDVSQATLPRENLLAQLRTEMTALGIQTVFQTTDVFNRKKRILLFDLRRSFLDAGTTAGLLKQTGLAAAALRQRFGTEDPAASLRVAAGLLEGLSLDVVQSVVGGLQASEGAAELVQTLRVLGYKVALRAAAFSWLTDALACKLGLDHVYGVSAGVDDDRRVLLGDAPPPEAFPTTGAVVEELVRREFVSREDITVVDDQAGDATPGLRVEFDTGALLGLYNQRVLTGESLSGLLAGCGLLRL